MFTEFEASPSPGQDAGGVEGPPGRRAAEDGGAKGPKLDIRPDPVPAASRHQKADMDCRELIASSLVIWLNRSQLEGQHELHELYIQRRPAFWRCSGQIKKPKSRVHTPN